MDEYDLVVKSKLKYKGDEKKKKSKTKKDKKLTTERSQVGRDERAEDADDHGGWWSVTRHEQIRGDMAIEFLSGCYAKSLNNGRIVLGEPHPTGDGPDEEEIFTALGAGLNRIALKSGYAKYLAIDGKNRLMGLSDAIGELESFTPVFEDDKLAICAQNLCFLSADVDSKTRQLVARSTTVGPNEVCRIRLNHDPLKLDQK